MVAINITSPAGDVLPLAYLEREIILSAARHYDWNMTEVARRLGIGRSTLYRRMWTYGIVREE